MANLTKEKRQRRAALAQQADEGATPETENNVATEIYDAPLQPAPIPTPTVKPKKQLVASGAGLVDYEQFIIRAGLGNRINAADQAGTAVSVLLVKKLRSSKNPEKAMEKQNKHVGGCILAAPANPNECTWWFKSGTVQQGKMYKAETVLHKSIPGQPAITMYKELKIYVDQPLN